MAEKSLTIVRKIEANRQVDRLITTRRLGSMNLAEAFKPIIFHHSSFHQDNSFYKDKNIFFQIFSKN